MKIHIITISVVILVLSAHAWGLRVKPARERPVTMPEVSSTEETGWIAGEMTGITKDAVVIDGREYSLSRSAVVRYPDGQRVKDLHRFRAAQSVHVSVRFSGGFVEELVIEGMEQKK